MCQVFLVSPPAAGGAARDDQAPNSGTEGVLSRSSRTPSVTATVLSFTDSQHKSSIIHGICRGVIGLPRCVSFSACFRTQCVIGQYVASVASLEIRYKESPEMWTQLVRFVFSTCSHVHVQAGSKIKGLAKRATSHPPNRNNKPRRGVVHEEDVDIVPRAVGKNTKSEKPALAAITARVAQITALLFVQKPQSKLYCHRPCCVKKKG